VLKRLIPALGQTLLSETDDMGLVKRLWEMKTRDGAEISAILFFDSALGEAVVKLRRGPGQPDPAELPRQSWWERDPYWTAQRCWDGVTRYRPGRANYSEATHRYDPFVGLKDD
jgi:hypothetical protein